MHNFILKNLAKLTNICFYEIAIASRHMYPDTVLKAFTKTKLYKKNGINTTISNFPVIYIHISLTINLYFGKLYKNICLSNLGSLNKIHWMYYFTYNLRLNKYLFNSIYTFLQLYL